MFVLSKATEKDVKKLSCPICGGRLCDIRITEKVSVEKCTTENELILKCYKCKNKIGIKKV